MRECQHCHKETQYIVQVFDTGTGPPLEYDHPLPKEWCLGCIYREGNHQHYQQNPINPIGLD